MTIPGINLKIKLGKLIFPLLLFVAVIVVLFNFSEIKEIGRLFAEAKWYWLLAAFGSQFLNFFIQGNVYNYVYKILKFPKIKMVKLMKMGVLAIFLNFTIPSLGIAGFLTFLKILKRDGVKEGRTLLAIMIELLAYYIAFVLLLFLSLIYLFFKLGQIGSVQTIAAIAFVLLVIFVSGFVYWLVHNKKRLEKRLNWFAQKIEIFEEGESNQEKVKEMVDDFHQDFNWLKKNKRKTVGPIALQFIKYLSDGLTIFFIFLAFGVMSPIGLGVVVFALGRLFGLVSFIPGGLGAFEGAMVLIMSSLGYSLEISLSVMLVYRFYSFWLYFPLGLLFYRQLTNDKPRD